MVQRFLSAIGAVDPAPAQAIPSSMAKITVEQARELAKEAREWTSSAEGKKQLEEAADRAKKTIDELEQAQQVDPQKLSEPFTV